MPHGRYGHDATLGPDGKIYVMGGMVWGGEKQRMYNKYNDGMRSNLMYDPGLDKWEYRTPVPGWYQGPSMWMVFDQQKREWVYQRYQHGMTIPPNVRHGVP